MNRAALLVLLLCPVIARAAEPPAPTETSRQPEKVSAGDAGATMDRLDLDASVITGNQELPKVLYIVPWKKSVAGDLPEPPVSSLLEEILAPVDREVFRRQVSYYEALHSEEQ